MYGCFDDWKNEIVIGRSFGISYSKTKDFIHLVIVFVSITIKNTGDGTLVMLFGKIIK
jgi:hypothetical protein